MRLEIVSQDSGTDDCREDSQGDGNNLGDFPGYKIYNSVGVVVVLRVYRYYDK